MSNIGPSGAAAGGGRLDGLRARVILTAKNRHFATTMKTEFQDILKHDEIHDAEALKGIILKFSEKLDAIDGIDEAKKNTMLRLFSVSLLSTDGFKNIISVATNDGLDIGIDLPGSKSGSTYHFSDHRGLLAESSPIALHREITDVAYQAFQELGLIDEVVVAVFEGDEEAVAVVNPANPHIPDQGKAAPGIIKTFINNTITPILNIMVPPETNLEAFAEVMLANYGREVVPAAAAVVDAAVITPTSPDFPEFVLRTDAVAIQEWVSTYLATLPADTQVETLSRIMEILIENKIINTEGNVSEGALFMYDVISMGRSASPASLAIRDADGADFYVNERDACILCVNNVLAVLKDKCTTGGMDDTASLANTPYTQFLSMVVDRMPETLEELVLTEAQFLAELESTLEELQEDPAKNAEEISKIQLITRLNSTKPFFKIKSNQGHETSIHEARKVENNFSQYTVWQTALQATEAVYAPLEDLDDTSLAALFTSDVVGGSQEEIAADNARRTKAFQTELLSINDESSARAASRLSALDGGREGHVLTDTVDPSQEARTQKLISLQIQLESLKTMIQNELIPLAAIAIRVDPGLLSMTLDGKFEPLCTALTQVTTEQSATSINTFLRGLVAEHVIALKDCSEYIKDLKDSTATLRLLLKEAIPQHATRIDAIPSFANPEQTPIEALRSEIEFVSRRCLAPDATLESILATIEPEEGSAVAAAAAGGGGADVAQLAVVEIFSALDSGQELNFAAIADGILRDSGRTAEFATQRIRNMFRR